MSTQRVSRRGVTLAELMVVIVILGVMAGVTGVAFTTRATVAAADARMAILANTRTDAVQSGQPATKQLEIFGQAYLITAFPDGQIVTDVPLPVDRLSGRPTHAQR